MRRSREAADTNVGVAKHAAGIIGACQGQTPMSRPLDLSGLSTVTADASLVASRYTRMKNGLKPINSNHGARQALEIRRAERTQGPREIRLQHLDD